MREKFNFTNHTPEEFDAHINKSIPNLDRLHGLIPLIAESFKLKNSNVYDIGCSTGRLLNRMSGETNRNGISYIGYDIADNLFNTKYLEDNVKLYKRNVSDESLTMFNTSLILSVFTLQFLTLPERTKLIKKVYDSLDKRGCFLVCEKVYSNYGFVEDIFTSSNEQLKSRNGFDALEITTKKHDLKTIMFPLSQKENEQLFRDAGFEIIEVFFKSLNFLGWVLIK